MNTLRGRLILSHALPLLFVAPLIGVALAYLLETRVLLHEVSDDLAHEARLVVETLRNRPDIWRDSRQAAVYVARIDVHTDRRLFLLSSSGQLWASNDQRDLDHPGWPLDAPCAAMVAIGQQGALLSYDAFTPRVGVLLPIDDGRQVIGVVGMTRTFDGAASPFAQLRWFVMAMLVVEILLSTAVGLLLARRIERPIQRAVAAVIAIADGAAIEPLPATGLKEIRHLSVAVNQLAERLEQLEELRRRAFANIVHELGRPLGAMRSAIHALRLGAGDDQAIREELLAGVEDEIIRMQPLLDDLTQLHAQVLGTSQLARRRVALHDWAASVIVPWRAAALAKGLEWHTSIPADLPIVDIDPDRLAQALGNLLSNAIKYTPASGSVAIGAGASQSDVWIAVADTGPGITAEEHERVFEPFYRSVQQRRFPQGLGLGLTIARELVAAHGGTIILTSAPGVGSRFTIYLPMLIDDSSSTHYDERPAPADSDECAKSWTALEAANPRCSASADRHPGCRSPR